MRMTARLFALVLLLAAASLATAAEPLDPATGKATDNAIFFDALKIGLEGKAFDDTKLPYDRLPAKAEGKVRGPVWNLSRHSAGMAVRFVTDSPSIHCRWTVTNAKLEMPHMAATGVSGVDLYVRTEAGAWHWLAVGKPTAQTTTASLIANLPKSKREYLLYLPLYNGVSSLEVGVAKDATLWKPDPRPADKAKPVVFYGTSITHGACASRPGMCHPAILGRRLDRPVVNLGFSGNGTMDDSVGTLLAEIDAAVYIIDCLPNITAKEVTARTEPLVKALRKAKPETSIVLVEDRNYADSFLVESKAKRNKESQAALKQAFEKLKADGVTKLHYIEGAKLLGADGDDTVDSSHPSDLGFWRHADAFEPVLREALKN